jgi:hypothetical protein
VLLTYDAASLSSPRRFADMYYHLQGLWSILVDPKIRDDEGNTSLSVTSESTYPATQRHI